MAEEIIKVEGLNVGYGEQVVLKHLDFGITEGEITVILGQSGCGKSTILKTLIGLLPPLSGRVTFFGEKVDYSSERAMDKLYKRIGVLYQGSALLNSLTLYENVSLPIHMQHPGLQRAIEREMVHARLSQVGLAGSMDKYPSELSGGMRKRAALARAMILDPDIIFCDEPSAGLDPITAAGLDDLMRNLRDLFGITFLVVTHELRSIEKISDKALVLNNGRLHYFGDYQNMLSMNDEFIDTFFMKDKKDDH
ncbi:MAG: ATP-binding cassette domain-containing protein [bacterium]|nr:ATP-binding cassette domain-containing protein [bacterium]